jgi:hypothetical protein
MTKSCNTILFCSKVSFFKLVPKYGSPNNEYFSDFKSNFKFELVASWSENNLVVVLLNIFGNANEYIYLS